jgi:hypothetical protein
MHNRLVRLVLEVAVPTTPEVWSRPLLHLSEFLFSRPDLDTGLDAIGGKRSSTFDVPFVKDCFLNFRNTSDEVIEALSVCCDGVST